MKLLWIDCETGGTEAKLHDITEIAGIVEIDGHVVEEFQLLLQPSMERRVTREALLLQNRTVDQVMSHPFTQREGKEKLVEVMGRYVDKYNRSDKFTWAGQNPLFDISFVQHLFKTQGDPYFGSWIDYHPLDLMAVIVALKSRGYFTGLPNFRLSSICRELNVELNNAHNAFDDIRATRAAYYKAISLIPEAPTRI